MRELNIACLEMNKFKMSVSRSTTWWKDSAQSEGLAVLDKHVEGDADWEKVAKTGDLDFQRALKLTSMPTGRHLTALEIGCGAGRMTWAMAQHFGEVVATDVSEAFVQLAREKNRCPNVTFLTISGDSLAVADIRQYDVAFSYEVFHYLDPEVVEQYVKDVFGLLKPGGRFVFEVNTVPVRLITRASQVVRRILHSCGRKHWRGWPTSPHFCRKPCRVESIVGSIEKHGFVAEQVVQPQSGQTWFVAVKPSEQRRRRHIRNGIALA